jgi:excinuclease UvrABC nuclease subunit
MWENTEQLADRRKRLLDGIPATCGVYIFRNINGHINYIGKAVNLRRRVMQYFSQANRTPTEPKDCLARYVEKVEWIPCETELHALLLENELIKSYRPLYNRKLKKYLAYTYIGIPEGLYPALVLLGAGDIDSFSSQGEIFGPFQDEFVGIRILDLVRKYGLLRGCTGRLPAHSCIRKELEFCLAPCSKDIPVQVYDEGMRKVKGFLSGKESSLLTIISNHMLKLGHGGDYEQAARVRDQLFFAESLLLKNHFYREFKYGSCLLHARGRWQGSFLFNMGELVFYSQELVKESACKEYIPAERSSQSQSSCSVPDTVLYDRALIVLSWSRSDGKNRTIRFLDASWA